MCVSSFSLLPELEIFTAHTIANYFPPQLPVKIKTGNEMQKAESETLLGERNYTNHIAEFLVWTN